MESNLTTECGVIYTSTCIGHDKIMCITIYSLEVVFDDVTRNNSVVTRTTALKGLFTALVTYPICPLLLNTILYLGTTPVSTKAKYCH